MRLCELKGVDLSEYWKHKPSISPVGLQVKQTEAVVGRFNVDILAEEENTGHKIIIENQLGTTDHTHVGQLITYAAELDAEFAVWLVRDLREEHRQAIDWLDEHTDEQISFFLVAIELWQIGDSFPTPKLNVVSRPNEWKRLVRTSAQDRDLTDTKTKQLEFWQQLKDYAATGHPQVKFRTPRPQHWFDFAIGRPDCHISLLETAVRTKFDANSIFPIPKSFTKPYSRAG